MNSLARLLPVRKVSAATAGAAAAQIFVYYIAHYHSQYALTPDQEALVTVALTFIAGWLIKAKDKAVESVSNQVPVQNRGLSLPVGPRE